MSIRSLAIVLPLLVAACGGGPPTAAGIPDFRGTYASATFMTLEERNAGDQSLVVHTCPGSLTISDQTGTGVSGRFATGPCELGERASGILRGVVRASGELSLDLIYPDAPAAAAPAGCTLRLDPSYTGMISASRITATRVATVDCAANGGATVAATFRIDASR